MKPIALIVDEKNENLEKFRRTLQKYGFDVLATSFPSKVPQILEKNCIDYIHINLSFEEGEMDGLDVISAIEKRFKEIPVIAIYSDFSKKQLEKAKLIEIDDSIKRYEKSFDYDVVALEILKLINYQISLKINKAVNDYISTLPKNKKELLEGIFDNMNPIVRIIELKPTLLLEKLEEKLKLIGENIDKRNYKRNAKKHFSNFTYLVLKCLSDYFSDSIYTHILLADHLIEFCSHVENSEDNDFITKSTIEALQYFIEFFKNKNLSEGDVHDSKTYLSQASGIDIGSLYADSKHFANNFMDDYVD